MKKIVLSLIFCLVSFQGYSQINFQQKIEIGYMHYQSRTIDVKPGPDWKGYNLDYYQNGVDFNVISGFSFKDKLFAGIGLAYLNFEGISGISVFSDFEYLPLRTRLTPLVNLKIGYSHIWNQYENGRGTGLGELCVGLNFRLTNKIDIYTKSGFTITQQSTLIPIKMGVRI